LAVKEDTSMDMGMSIAIIKRLWQSIKLLFDIVGIIQVTLWLIGGGAVTGAGIIASLQKLPIIVPIALLILGIGALIFATTKTIYRYKLWNNLKNVPELDDAMKKALDIHIRIGKLHDVVVEQNRGKNVKTKLRQTLAKKYLESVGISLVDLANGINPDGTFKKKLYRKIRKFYGLKEGDYFTVLPHLKDYGRLLDRAKLGLRDAIRADTECEQLKNEFMKLQLQLSIPSKTVNDINNLPELSYGLYSASVGTNLVHEGRTWYKHVPDSWIKQKDETKNMLDTAYLKATMWAKNRVKRAMFEEALK
jgi:hypothetical protein